MFKVLIVTTIYSSSREIGAGISSVVTEFAMRDEADYVVDLYTGSRHNNVAVEAYPLYE